MTTLTLNVVALRATTNSSPESTNSAGSGSRSAPFRSHGLCSRMRHRLQGMNAASHNGAFAASVCDHEDSMISRVMQSNYSSPHDLESCVNREAQSPGLSVSATRPHRRH